MLLTMCRTVPFGVASSRAIDSTWRKRTSRRGGSAGRASCPPRADFPEKGAARTRVHGDSGACQFRKPLPGKTTGKINRGGPVEEDRRVPRLRNTIRDQFAARRHTALLVAIVVAFAVRPLVGDGGAGYIAFSAALLILLLIALYNINVDELMGERENLLVQSRRRRRIGWLLVAAAFVERLGVAYAGTHMLDLIGSIGWLLLLCFVTWSTLRGLLKQREITGETISMSISVYLLLGFTWGLLYAVIFLLQPDAFSI